MYTPIVPKASVSNVDAARHRFARIIAAFKKYGIWLQAGDTPHLHAAPWMPIGDRHKSRFEVTYPDEGTPLSVAYVVWPTSSDRGPGLRIGLTSQHVPADLWQCGVLEPCDEDLGARFAGPRPDVHVHDGILSGDRFDALLERLINVYQPPSLPA